MIPFIFECNSPCPNNPYTVLHLRILFNLIISHTGLFYTITFENHSNDHDNVLCDFAFCSGATLYI